MRALVDGGADIGTPDNQGNTALTIAEEEDDEELVAVLREATTATGAGKARP